MRRFFPIIALLVLIVGLLPVMAAPAVAEEGDSLIINNDTANCNTNVAINNAIGQSFKVDAPVDPTRISIWIKPELYYNTSYKIELHDGEGPGGPILATSTTLNLVGQDDGALSGWYDFSFSASPVLQPNHAYTFIMLRLSQYSGAFAQCDNVYPNGILYWLGSSAMSYRDMSFRLYGYVLNRPPQANAGPDQTVVATSMSGASVILNGSGSSDPDNDPLTYSWTWSGGSASGVSPTVTLPIGTRIITLTVSDGEDSDTDTVSITVEGPILTVSGSVTYTENAVPVVIAPGLTLTGPSIDGAKVAIATNFSASQDSLGIAGQAGTTGTISGLSWSYNTGTGIMALSGTASAATYQSALRQVTYRNSSDNPSSAPRKITFSIGENTLYYADTGHYYEYVPAAGIYWTNANTAANSRYFYGLQGYLVTITSQGENSFVTSKLQGMGWMGASDAGEDLIWRWKTGPEAGTHFFTQTGTPGSCSDGSGGSVVAGKYANWAASEPNDWPSQCPGGEDYGHFYTNGYWNDFYNNNSSIQGYVVEYGGMPGDPTLALSGNVTVNVQPVNDAPVAANDGYTTNEDTVLSISAPGVLGNDSDVEGNPLTASVVTGPAKGSVTLNSNGSFTYTPNANANGADSFTYKANDGLAYSGTATVTITINPVNDLPVAVDDSATTDANTPVVINVLANDSDPEGDALSITGVGTPSNGSVLFGKTFSDPVVGYEISGSYPIPSGLKPTGSTMPVLKWGGLTYWGYSYTDNRVALEIVAYDGAKNIVQQWSKSGDRYMNKIYIDTAGQKVYFRGQYYDGGYGPGVIMTYAELSAPLTQKVQYTPNTNYVGADSFTYTISDGNGGTDSATVSVTVLDTIPPTVITKDITVQLNASGQASITAADVNNGSYDAFGIASMTVSPNAFDCSDIGPNTVTLTVTDTNGNVATGTATVTVEDNIAPVAQAKDITVQLDVNGQASIVAADVNNGSSDACGIAGMTVSPNAFDCSNLGANTVTLTVTDNNGNVSTATATVTVIDTTKPVLTIPGNVTVEQATAAGTVVPLTATATDICDANVTVTSNVLAVYPLGTTTVTFTATDDSGNSSSGSVTVTVIDTTKPVLTIPGNVTVEQATAAGTVVPLTATATDICDANVLITSNALAVYPLGTTTVTFTATDDSGNSSSGSMTVTVVDTTKPAVTVSLGQGAPYYTTQTIGVNYTVNDICDAAPVVQVTLSNNGGAPVAITAASPISLNLAALAGQNVITVTATDASGNVGTASTSFEVILQLVGEQQIVIKPESLNVNPGEFTAHV
ncbi:MAG: Ig-like domain-containing protein, partial [Dehalococcoidia bacterium]